QWSAYLEAMDGVAPTAEVPAQARALLAIAFCEPGWIPPELRRDAPQAVWEALTVSQLRGLLHWSQSRRRHGDH
ncbi:MAG: hypothetical protein AB1761_16025, partial [Pseudomonadota bacterium]